MKTFASLFTGFGGADIGALASGLQLAWGLELSPEIAEVANANLGDHVRVMDVLDANPADFERVDFLHASPPCTRASQANNSAETNEEGTKEALLDIELAGKVIEFVDVLRPRVFTLENVYAYRNFQSWRGGKKCEGILNALERLGYWVSVQHVNAADYGVPQTRRRMIVRAVLGGWVPYLPSKQPWRGWYQAIEDLVPGLPDDEFAPWQIERLPVDIKSLIMSGKDVGQERGKLHREGSELAQTITVIDRPSHMPRALILPASGNTNFAEAYPGRGERRDDEPMHTVSAGDGASFPRAFITDGQTNEGERLTVRAENDPMFTVLAGSGSKHSSRAWLSAGRVVSMTPRALARFQTFPDRYALPEKNSLACKGIGNAVPPKLAETVFGGLMEAQP